MIKEPRIEEVIAKRRERAFTRSGYVELLGRVAVLALVVWLVFTYGFLICQCVGQHMFPAMKDGDLCIIFRTPAQTLMGERFAAGDIVAYRAEGKRYIGRVAAVAGDVVQMNDSGSMTVNGSGQSGEILFPTYARGELAYPYTVPQGCLYVLGDRRTDTQDSRDFGPIPMESVEGKVITILRRRGL